MRERPTRSGLRTLAVAVLAICGLAAAALHAAAAQATASAQDVVEATSKDMLKLIEESRAWVDENPERFYAAVTELLNPVIDFDGFARSVMAVYYKRATPDQRRRFAQTFKSAPVRTYALALTEFKDGEVLVQRSDRPPARPDRDQVAMEIRLSSREVYPVLYDMELGKDGRWRVRNIRIKAFNIGLTYRDQFKGAMSDPRYGGDMDKVIDAWGTVVARDKPSDEQDS
jgi:phospholipid transport system substrate-binding protein